MLIASNAYALTVGGYTVGSAAVGTGSTTTVQVQVTGAATTTPATAAMGLSAQVQAGATIDAASGAALVQTSDDLATYNTLVIKARPAVTAINVQSDGSVVVGYSQPAKFLGLFSTSITGNVDVDAQGNATVHLPWWSVFYSKDTTGVQAAVSTAVQESGVNFAAQVDAMATAQNAAQVINAATSAIQAQTQVSAAATTSASY